MRTHYTRIQKKCVVCKLDAKVSLKSKEPLCWRHYLQKRRHGNFLVKTIYDPNDIEVRKNYALVVIRDKNGEIKAKCKIDKEEVDKIKTIKWGLNKGYASSIINGKLTGMHQIIIGTVSNKEIDHINRNPLDNRKTNLRHVSHSENTANRIASGVTWDKSRNQWQAQIVRENKKYFLGRFSTRQMARRARLKFERDYLADKNYDLVETTRID